MIIILIIVVMNYYLYMVLYNMTIGDGLLLLLPNTHYKFVAQRVLHVEVICGFGIALGSASLDRSTISVGVVGNGGYGETNTGII